MFLYGERYRRSLSFLFIKCFNNSSKAYIFRCIFRIIINKESPTLAVKELVWVFLRSVCVKYNFISQRKRPPGVCIFKLT